MPMLFISGFIYDNLGRRAPIIWVFFIVAVMIAIYPFGGSVYPGLLLIRICLLNALDIQSTSPLLVDYVEQSTKGLAGGYIQAVVCLSAIIFSFGFL